MTSREGSSSHIKDVIESSLGQVLPLRKLSTKRTRLSAEDLPVKDELPERFLLKEALLKRMGNKINQNEFMSEVLSWSYKYGFESGGYMPDLEPSRPIEVAKLAGFTKEEYKNINPNTLSKLKEKKVEWLGEIEAVKVRNSSNLAWLKKMLKYFKYKGDVMKIKQIQNRINQYD